MFERCLTRRKFLLITAAGLGMTLLDSCNTGSPSPQPLSKLPLGVNIHFTSPQNDIDMISAARLGYVRMDFTWKDIENQKGRYDFSTQESLVKAFTKQGIQTLGILAYGNPLYDNSKDPFHVGPGTEEVQQAFANFAKQAAIRFKDFNIMWEVWNEPNNPDFWQPNPSAEEYVKLAKLAIAAIRDADKKVPIMAPAAITSFPQRHFDVWNFLESCFAHGLLEQVNYISIHPYRSQPPEAVSSDYERLRSLAAKYTPQGKKFPPIISSEWGYPVTAEVSSELQAALLVRQFLINTMEGIRLSIWYDWQDDGKDPHNIYHNFGLLDFNHHPKPAYTAAKTLANEFSDFQFMKSQSKMLSEKLSLRPKKDFVMLFVKDNVKKFVFWTTDNSYSIQLDPKALHANAPYTFISTLGKTSSATPMNGTLTIDLTNSPLYLKAGIG